MGNPGLVAAARRAHAVWTLLVLVATSLAYAVPYEVVDTGGFFSSSSPYNSSLAEVGGLAAVVYRANGECRYAVRDGSPWGTPTATGARRPHSPLTEWQGQPAFVDGPTMYNAGDPEHLEFWVGTDTGWASTPINDSDGKHPSNFLCLDGKLHLGLTSKGGGKIYFSTLQDDGSWDHTLVFDGRDWMCGGGLCLADIGGHAAMAYRGGWTETGGPDWPIRLYYAENDGTDWVISPELDQIGINARPVSLTSFHGDPVIVYGNDGTDTVDMQIRRDGTWEKYVLRNALSCLSVSATECSGVLAVSYIGRAPGHPWGVHLGLYDGASWSWKMMDTIGQLDWNQTSVAEIDGRLGLAYESHSTNGELRYMSLNVPEPATMGLFGISLTLLLSRRRRRT